MMEKKQADWTYVLFVAVGIVMTGMLLAGCAGPSVPPAPQATEAPIVAPTPTPVDIGVVQTDFKVRRELPVVWAGPGDVGELPQLDHDDWEDLLAGGLVTTDDDGEGWVKVSDCRLIYIFQNSGLIKAACPKSDYTGGNVTCAIEGTSVFNNACASQVIIQTPSAELILEGTWLAVTYLPERQLTLVIVFEGAAKVRPVRNFDARILGKPVYVVEGHFWFTTPGVRADPIAGLAAREPHPFDQLLPVVEELDLWPWIDRIEVRADADNVPFPEFLTPTPTRTPTPKPAVQMRLKVTSTSDWTSVTLPSVGVIVEKRKVTQRGSTTYAYMEDRTIQLGQLLKRAEAGRAVEIVQDITLAKLAEGQRLRFKIEKGCLGETVVEAFNVETDTPTLVARLVVDVCEPRFFSVDTTALLTGRPPAPKWMPMRVKVTSTSDWTSVTLPSVGVIVEKRKVTVRGITTAAYMEDRTIQLGQLLERAKAGHAVEIVQDITLAELAEGQRLRFKIEKGCLGKTVVEVFNVVTDTPTLVARLVVDVCEPRFFSVEARALVPKGPPTSTPTQTLTRRPPARTPTPTRTPTPKPPTHTPTWTPKPPTHTPTPTPRKDYATPVLLEPLNQSTISSLPVTLKWGWDGTLGPDEYFDVRVWFGGQPAYGIAWTKERTFTIPQDHSIWRFGPGAYHWQIVVIQGKNGQWVRDLSRPSQEWAFQWIQAPQKGGIRGQVFCTSCQSPIKVRVARDQDEQWWYADDQGRFDTGLTLDPGSYYVYVSSFCGQQVSVGAGQYSDVVLNCQ